MYRKKHGETYTNNYLLVNYINYSEKRRKKRNKRKLIYIKILTTNYHCFSMYPKYKNIFFMNYNLSMFYRNYKRWNGEKYIYIFKKNKESNDKNIVSSK